MQITTTKIDQVQIQYTVSDEEYTYMDILYFSSEEYALLSEANITKLIEDKYAIWKAYITTPIPEKTKVEEEAMLAQFQREKVSLQKKIDDLTVKIASM